MKLYKLSQSRNNGWYTYDSAIVAANSKEEARTIVPSPFYFYDDNAFYYKYKNQEPKVEAGDPSWVHPKHVKAELIGTTELPKGLVTASFKPGTDISAHVTLFQHRQTIRNGVSPSTLTLITQSDTKIIRQLEDVYLNELRYHLTNAHRLHNLQQVQEYELKIRDYMNEEYEDWS